MNLLENQQAAEKIDSTFIDLEVMLMQNIAKHLKDYGQAIDSDRWLTQKLAEVGKLNKENVKIISKMAGISANAAERMLEEKADEALSALEPGFAKAVKRGLLGEAVDIARSKNVSQAMEMLHKQAKNTINICNTTMLYKAKEAYKGAVRSIVYEAKKIADKQDFLDILGKHATASIIGAESRQQALRKCIEAFNRRGIPAFVDKAGREWTPEAYVNMAMRNTARQTAEEMQTARCKDFGINLISIDSHSGARTKCAHDQGKIFDLNNSSGVTEDLNGRKITYYPWKSSSYGEPDGILGINCRHHKHPFMPGVNIQRYFPTDDYDANDKLYKQTQIQRALERDVRAQKRECMLYKELGDKEAFEKASIKLKNKEAKLKNYVDGNQNLHRRRDREQVVGFDKTASVKVISANRKAKSASAAHEITGKVLPIRKEATFKVKVPGYNKEINDVISDSCRKVVYGGGETGKEVLHLIDLDSGKVVFKEDGGIGFVGGKNYRDFIKENRGRYAFIHNHPDGDGLSKEDIATLLSEKIEIMIGSGNNGKVYVGVIPKKVELDLWKEYNDIEKIVKPNFKNEYALVREGELPYFEYSRLIENEVCSRLVKKYGQYYIQEI